MNVAARLCEYCKAIDRHLVVSGELLGRVAVPGEMRVSGGRSTALRGRREQIDVHAIVLTSSAVRAQMGLGRQLTNRTC